MKHFSQKYLTTLMLALVLAIPAFAGEMQFPAAPPPPQANGEIQFPGATSPTASGEIHTGLVEAALSLLQSVLTPF